MSLSARGRGSRRVQFPGVNRIVRRTKARVTIHWYAHRAKGAPRLASFEGATLPEAERAEADGAAELARAWEQYSTPRSSKAFVAGIIVAYKASPAWMKLAPSTQKEWTRWLDRIHVAFGDLSARAMSSKGARALILDWRDQYADRPRAADYGIQVLGRLLSWAKDRELVERNAAEDIEGLYRADRSELIWEEAHIKAALGQASTHVGAAIELLAHTGLRLGDVVRLTWSAVDYESGEIRWKTSKSRGRREAGIPITKELRRVLKGVEVKGPIVLTTALGRPWSSGNSLSHAIQAAAKAAKVERRTHDLRGTAATNLVAAGLSFAQVATILAWTEAEVERIARRYVSKGALSRAIAKQLDAAAGKGEA